MRSLLSASRPVAIFGNGLGDHLLVLPALRALADLFDGRLGLVCMAGAPGIFFSDLRLRSVSETVMQSVDGGKRFDADTVAREVGTCDLLLSLNPWHSSSMDRLLDLLAPPRSIGLHPSFETPVRLDFERHSAELAFEVPRRVNPTLLMEPFAGPPRFRAAAERVARELRALVPPPMRVLTVHADTGLWSADGAHVAYADIAPSLLRGNKMWPADRFVELLDTFLERHSDFVAFVVGGVDLQLDQGRSGSHVIQCCGLPLDVSFALVGSSDLFVGIDSCMLHAADLYRVPGVGLFGPTSPGEFGFHFSAHRHVAGGPFMEDLAVAPVLDALDVLASTLETKPSRDRQDLAADQCRS